MDEIYGFQVTFYSSMKKKLKLFSHIQDKIFQDCIFCITNCMNFHNHVIVQSVHFFFTHRPVPARCVCLPIGIPFTPVGGLLGGILGRRKIILFCQPFGLISWLIMANAQNVSTLLIARFLSSVSICCQASPGNYRLY